LADAVNTNGASVIQDKSKLNVVVLLINTKTGEVVNANKVRVSNSTGIDITEAGNGNVTTYYDLSGRRIQTPANGVYIKSVQTKDGKTRNNKVVVK
jgi:hypothetical protein